MSLDFPERMANSEFGSRVGGCSTCSTCPRYSCCRTSTPWTRAVGVVDAALVADRLVPGRVVRRHPGGRRAAASLLRSVNWSRIGMTTGHCTSSTPTAGTSAATSATAAVCRATVWCARFTAGTGTSDGRNTFIPYQPDRPNGSRRIRVWPVREQFGVVYLWHDAEGREPTWEPPNIFTDTAAAHRRAGLPPGLTPRADPLRCPSTASTGGARKRRRSNTFPLRARHEAPSGLSATVGGRIAVVQPDRVRVAVAGDGPRQPRRRHPVDPRRRRRFELHLAVGVVEHADSVVHHAS